MVKGAARGWRYALPRTRLLGTGEGGGCLELHVLTIGLHLLTIGRVPGAGLDVGPDVGVVEDTADAGEGPGSGPGSGPGPGRGSD